MLTFFITVNKVFFQVDDAKVCASFIHNVGQNVNLYLRTLVVSLDRTDDFDCIIFVLNYV